MSEGRIRGWLRAALGWVAYRLRLQRFVMGERAVIVLFHRVDDDLATNPISCTSRVFESYCRFFARHFEVIGLGDLVRRLQRGESVRNCLVITFDDGYVDNRAIAAPTLTAYDLTACFFITTGYIGTDRVGPWDRENGVVSRWMTWEHVRELHAQGFEIGAHTVEHVDLGIVSREEAARELSASRDDLESKLGTEIHHFAYPFGASDHMVESNRREVAHAGFLTCASACRGFVESDTSLLDLPRFPINGWVRSPFGFGLDLLRHGMAARRLASRSPGIARGPAGVSEGGRHGSAPLAACAAAPEIVGPKRSLDG